MTVFQSLEDARAYFEKDLFAMENGVVLESVSPGGAVCSLALTARHRNAEGGVMGGAMGSDTTWAASLSVMGQLRSASDE